MRVTGGEMRGRRICVPRGEVRPTQDRVREALFSSLQTVIGGARFLDLFAGSGAVGLDAWSRGAQSVCWVEADRMVFRRLRENVTNLCGQEAVGGDLLRCVRADVCGFLDGTAGEFDIIFADPPYDKRRVKRGVALVTQVLELILRSGRLAGSGLVVLEQGADEALPEAAGWRLVRERRYGGSCLRFFVLDSEPSVEEGL